MANPAKVITLICFSIALLHVSSFAQSSESKRAVGKLKGVVVDKINEARIAKASIKITGRKVKRKIVTDDEGTFQIKLPVGTYQITVQYTGFRIFNRKNVIVYKNATTTVDVTLKIAPSYQNIASGACLFSLASGRYLAFGAL